MAYIDTPALPHGTYRGLDRYARGLLGGLERIGMAEALTTDAALAPRAPVVHGLHGGDVAARSGQAVVRTLLDLTPVRHPFKVCAPWQLGTALHLGRSLWRTRRAEHVVAISES